MIIYPTFVFILISLSSKVYSKCSEIRSFENSLPSSITKLANDDLIGVGSIIWHNTYLRSLKYWPNYSDPKNCIAHVVKTGSRYFKFSLKPRGCCAHCCLIDNIGDHITVYLFSKNKPIKRINMASRRESGSLAALGVNNLSRTVIFFNGFGNVGYGGTWFNAISEAYLKKAENFNLLMVDYSDLVPLPWYSEGIENVKLVAKFLADFVIFYDKTGELPIESIHLVGLSLGAQLAGHLGRQIGKFKKVARVTGLDPAFVLYDANNSPEYISKDDGKFVDIIHTTSGILGVRKPTAHADFFIEYPPGVSRPGCNLLQLIDRGALGEFIYLCDHVRSIELYLHTILNPYLLPVCKNITVDSNSSEVCGYLGFAASKNTTIGEYHLATKFDWDPFEIPENVEVTR